jgi:hypothetical protein
VLYLTVPKWSDHEQLPYCCEEPSLPWRHLMVQATRAPLRPRDHQTRLDQRSQRAPDHATQKTHERFTDETDVPPAGLRSRVRVLPCKRGAVGRPERIPPFRRKA